MKKIFTLLFLIPLFASAQTEENRIQKDTLFFNGYKFVEGQQLQLGTASNTTAKIFNTIYTDPSSLGAITNLSANRNNGTLTIRKFKREGSKKDGYQYFIVVRAGGNINYWCDIAGALQSGEVKAPEVVQTQQAPPMKPVTGTVADELKKWKDLLDRGAITKDEYEKQKAKLLQ